MGKGKIHCGECRFAAPGSESYRCNFALLTGTTRRAHGIRGCVFFLRGKRCESSAEACRALCRAGGRMHYGGE